MATDCDPSPADCDTRPTDCDPSPPVCNPVPADRDPVLAVRNPPLAVRDPPPGICNPLAQDCDSSLELAATSSGVTGKFFLHRPDAIAQSPAVDMLTADEIRHAAMVAGPAFAKAAIHRPSPGAHLNTVERNPWTLAVGRVAPRAPAFGCRVSARPEVAALPATIKRYACHQGNSRPLLWGA